jgi:hypothetical protein
MSETATIVGVLKRARAELLRLKERPVDVEPSFPWRARPEEVERPDYDSAIYDIEQQIIDIERAAYRDPEQDAEMRMEMQAEFALTGVRDDPSLYMHTPFEEELFQERIRHDIDNGYYDDDGHWNEGLNGDSDYWSGPCPVCKTQTDVDEVHYLSGEQACLHCFEEAFTWMNFLAVVTNHKLRSNRYETEYDFSDMRLVDEEAA